MFFIGNTTGSLAAGLFTDAAVTIGRNLRIQSGNTGTMSIGGNTADSSIFSGKHLSWKPTALAAKASRSRPRAVERFSFSGVIQDPTGVSSGFGLW